MKRPIYRVQDRAITNLVKRELKEQMQENLLAYFDGLEDFYHDFILDGMCDVVTKTINEHE